MRKKVQHTIHTHHLVPDNTTIVVGVSGGGDSMAMLHILTHIAAKKNVQLVVAHVRYGVRDDAHIDQDIVMQFAAQNGWKCVVKDVANVDRKTHTEDWMRRTRHVFFEEVRAQENAQLIAIGHTRDDLVETFLLHLVRGSGLRGLSALAYQRDNIIRPLLDVTHAEVLEYCAKEQIPFRHDITNDDVTYLRNRVRHVLLPLLAEQFNPQIASTLAHTAHTISDDYQFLREYIAGHLIDHEYDSKALSVTFSAQNFIHQHPTLQRMTLHLFAEKLTNTTQSPLSAAHCSQLQHAIASSKNKAHEVTIANLILRKNGDRVVLMLDHV
jgi:tRNA(Ile)-lysidine synthase